VASKDTCTLSRGQFSSRRGIGASAGSLPQIGLPAEVQRDVAATPSVARPKPAAGDGHRPLERDGGNIMGAVVPYIVAQVAGAIMAAALLYIIAGGAPGFDDSKGFAANGYGAHSPGQYGLFASFLMELVMTAMFLFIIMGSTHGKAPASFAPIAIGLGLTLIHLVSIPVTNTSVNPARSTGPALFAGAWALGQLWLFWLAPLLGGAVGGFLYRWLSTEAEPEITGGVRPANIG
jgi:hypothetical protein